MKRQREILMKDQTPRCFAPYLIATLALLSCISPVFGASLTNLRCEYLSNPLGIDAERPRLSWVIESARRGERQTAYRVLAASTPELLAKEQGDLWDSGNAASDQSIQVEYGGKPLLSRTRCHWKVRIWDKDGKASAWSQPALWTMGLLKRSDWTARMIATSWPGPTDMPLPWFRKTFVLDAKPKRATAYVCALGYYELYINGRKVGDHVLSPAVCDYTKHAFYVTHDISDYLAPGKNCIGVWLGRGWFSKGKVRGAFHDGPVVMAQFDIGDSLRIGTDETWKVRPSPITALGSGIVHEFGGERYDAAQELPGWSSAALDDSGWSVPVVVQPPNVEISAQMVEPNRITETLTATSVTQAGPGKYVVDMGRNFSGWIEMKVRGRKGQTLTIHYPYPTYGPQQDEYIMRDDGVETWQNCRFNYHATRTFTVSGFPEKPEAADIKGYLIHTDYEAASEFACSNEQLNWIYRTVCWTERCLTLGGYAVDCPHRERMGYGDGSASMETMLYNFGAGAFYTKWLGDWRDGQDPVTGDMPHVAPAFYPGPGGGPAWGDICVVLPWQVYLQYGDRRVLEANYPTIQRWLKFQDSKTTDGLLRPYVGIGCDQMAWSFLGDWVPPRGPGQGTGTGASRSVLFFNNGYYLYNLEMAGKMARVLGKTQDGAAYGKKVDALRAAMQREFKDPDDGAYAEGEQTPLALSLLTSLIPQGQRGEVEARLERDIVDRRKGHLDTGILGTYFLIKELTDLGRHDLVYTMVNQTTFPGWGHMMKNDATTIWEEWGGGNSGIHSSFLSIGAWFIEGIGGIQGYESNPGFAHFLIRPGVVGDLKFARTKYRSIRGDIISNWQREGGKLSMDLTIPANTTATVFVPAKDAAGVAESGKPAGQAEGVKFLRLEGDYAVFGVGSGKYSFAAAFRTGGSALKELPMEGEVFQVEGHTAFLILPKDRLEGRPTPWVWYAPALPGLPGAEEGWMFEKFLAAGIAIAGVDVGESYGSPRGRALFSAFHTELVRNRGMAGKACLLARSRGGLMLYNWACENPESVASIAGIYPVCNLTSYPGVAKACGAYDMSAAELSAQLPRHNPLDRLAPLAKAKVPIFHIHGDADAVVPLKENSGELAKRYHELGGTMELVVPPGQGHNMWPGFFQCEELVEFVIKHAASKDLRR
jgi:alpha-L-rhamnosidase